MGKKNYHSKEAILLDIVEIYNKLFKEASETINLDEKLIKEKERLIRLYENFKE